MPSKLHLSRFSSGCWRGWVGGGRSCRSPARRCGCSGPTRWRTGCRRRRLSALLRDLSARGCRSRFISADLGRAEGQGRGHRSRRSLGFQASTWPVATRPRPEVDGAPRVHGSASGSGGIREAAPGLFPGPIAATQLTPDTVKGILHQSGTILRTSDRGEPRPGPGARGDAPRCRAHRAHRRDRVLQRDLLSLADVTALGLTARGMADRALKTSSSQGAEEASARPAQSRERRAGRTRRRPGPRQLSIRRGR